VPVTLPEGLPFTLELMAAIRADTAAVGDRFSGRLAGPLVDRDGKVLAVAGAKVEGRLTQVRTVQWPKAEAVLSLLPEAIEAFGSTLPLAAIPVAAGALHFSGQHVVVKTGFRSKWLTAPRATAGGSRPEGHRQ